MRYETKFLQAQVRTDTAANLTFDVVEYGGGLWLVPLWTTSAEEEWQRPARMIRIDELPHDMLRGLYVLSLPIPKGILSGESAPHEALGFVIVDSPDDCFRAARATPAFPSSETEASKA